VKTLAKVGIILAFAAIAGGVVVRRRLHASHPPPPPHEDGRAVHVPLTSETLTLDGELTESSWHSAPVTRFIGEDGKDARPYSEVRFLWSRDGILHVGLYASDKNIVSAGVPPDGPVWRGDSFHLVFAKDGVEHSFDIGPTDHGPVLTDGERKSGGAWTYGWQSGARVALDMDEGTVDQPRDRDEEWVIELNVPLASIGLASEAGQTIEFTARRCDLDERGGQPLELPCPSIALSLTLDP